MKKNILILFAAFLMAAGLLACGAENKDIASDNENLQIVATIFPEYDWVKNILGENPANADVTLLLDSGVDLHSYQLTADDMMKISTCDMFIYVGGESDEWVEDALAEAVNKDMKVVNLMEALGLTTLPHLWAAPQKTKQALKPSLSWPAKIILPASYPML